jgi:hypothetical protein
LKLNWNNTTLDFSLQRKTEPITLPQCQQGTQTLNIGLMEGDGFEFDLGLHVVRNANRINWNINTNFTTSKMIVKDLGGADNLTVAGFTNLPGNQAIVGNKWALVEISTTTKKA